MQAQLKFKNIQTIQPQLFGVLLVLFTIFWQTALIALYLSVYNRHISSWSQQDLADHQAPELSSPYEYGTNDSYYFSRSTSQHVHFGSCDSSRLVWLQMKSELFGIVFVATIAPLSAQKWTLRFFSPGLSGVSITKKFLPPLRGHCQLNGDSFTKNFEPT